MNQNQRDRFTELMFFLTFERYGEEVLTDAEREELSSFGKMHPMFQHQIDNWRKGYTFDGQKIGEAVKEHAAHMEGMDKATDNLLQDCKITRPPAEK